MILSEKIYAECDGDLDRIAEAIGSRENPARWKDGVTREYVQNAERFARLLMEGQLLWSERAPAIGSLGASGTEQSGGSKSRK